MIVRWGKDLEFRHRVASGVRFGTVDDEALDDTMTLKTWKKTDLKNLSELLIRLYCKEETYNELGPGRREVEAIPGSSAREMGRVDGR